MSLIIIVILAAGLIYVYGAKTQKIDQLNQNINLLKTSCQLTAGCMDTANSLAAREYLFERGIKASLISDNYAPSFYKVILSDSPRDIELSKAIKENCPPEYYGPESYSLEGPNLKEVVFRTSASEIIQMYINDDFEVVCSWMINKTGN